MVAALLMRQASFHTFCFVQPVIGSLALGALVHLASEASYAFLGSALALWLGMCQRREKSLILSLAKSELSEGGGSSR